jgi:hypothetical protein
MQQARRFQARLVGGEVDVAGDGDAVEAVLERQLADFDDVGFVLERGKGGLLGFHMHSI